MYDKNYISKKLEQYKINLEPTEYKNKTNEHCSLVVYLLVQLICQGLGPGLFCLQFSGKRVGIIGLGRIGLSIAKRVEGFGCPVCYYQRTRQDAYPNYTYLPTVLQLAANSDVLVVACSLNEQSRGIVSREVIEALGPTGVLVNVGRGAHVDEPELVAALADGRLGGAGLDVFQAEPDVPQALMALDNVVLAPHMGSGTRETRKAMADLVLANLEAHALNMPLLTPVV